MGFWKWLYIRRNEKLMKMDKRFNTVFDKAYVDVLVEGGSESVTSGISGCIVHPYQIMTKRGNKIYPAGENDIPIGINMWSNEEGKPIGVIGASTAIVNIIAGNYIKKGDAIISTEIDNLKGFGKGTKEKVPFQDNEIIGIALEDIKRMEAGKIYIFMPHINPRKYWEGVK